MAHAEDIITLKLLLPGSCHVKPPLPPPPKTKNKTKSKSEKLTCHFDQLVATSLVSRMLTSRLPRAVQVMPTLYGVRHSMRDYGIAVASIRARSGGCDSIRVCESVEVCESMF